MPIVHVFLGGIIQNDYGELMDDITGKKFSLQDWVTRRAANQTGGMASRVSVTEAVQPVSVKRAVNGDDDDGLPSSAVTDHGEKNRDAAMSHMVDHDDVSADNEEKSEDRMAIDAFIKPDIKAATVGASSGSPVQQLQIVRLLSDLGERLRQSEKEREVLWKELETFRKLIGDLDSKNTKSEQSYQALKNQVGEKDEFISGLLNKQTEIEALVKNQTETFETAKIDQADMKGRLEEKLSTIETATGSAIVRIEDALAENTKLAKRVEQLGQDKVRLTRKLEAMEETLAQTQETLRAKALVLLTDQALATRTNLPQTPAWTGDDTLKVSRPVEREEAKDSGPVSDIAASIKKQRQTSDISNKAFIAALVVLVIAAGVLVGQMSFRTSNMGTPVAVSAKSVDKNADNSTVVPTDVSVSSDQEELMANIAELANKIEPASVDAGVTDLKDDILEPSEFDKAIDAEDRALEAFNADAPRGEVSSRLKTNPALPKAVRGIEVRALAGEATAQHDLAAIYTAGHSGVKVNYDLAAKWFTEAAHQNIANAQYNLGVLTQQGLGVKQNVGKAIDLYRVAAANGHPEAQYNLAIAYIEGVGTEYNPQIAAAYFQKSAAGGIVEGAYNLGLLHENGLLGESQPDEAVFWYTLAANKGNEQAKNALAQLKEQLSMSDADAARIVDRVAQTKPGFLNADGKAALPESANEKFSDVKQVSEISSVPVSTPDPVSAPEIDPVLVTQIQERLLSQGFYTGSPNGEMSAPLSNAIRSYQKAHGLKADGLVNEDLLVHILASGE